MNFSDFLIWSFWAYLEVICKKLWKKSQNSTLQGQKTAIFGPFFGHFRSFSDLEIFLVNDFFWFFNMMVLGIFRSDLKKMVKKGSKFDPPGPKNGHFWPFFGHFRSFSDLEIFLVNEFFWFFYIMFLGIFRNDLQKIVKKGSKFGPPGAKKNNHFWSFFGHFHSFLDLKIFLVNEFFWFFNMMFLGIFRSDLHNLFSSVLCFIGIIVSYPDILCLHCNRFN